MAEASDSDQEKTLDPSERKIQQAREEGQIARSRELSAALATFACVLVLAFMGTGLVHAAAAWVQYSFREAGAHAARVHLDAPLFDVLMRLSGEALLAAGPLMLAGVVAGILGSVSLGGLLWSGKALEPKFERMDPIKGLGRIFSLYGLAELGKSILKVVLLGGLAGWIVWSSSEEWIGLLIAPSAEAALAHLGLLLRSEVLILAGALFVIAAVDVPIQWWNHHKQLRMTPEEMKREFKESEGDPMVKARVRQIQRERARARMMQAVPTADVIITNPTHFAVALRYEEGRMQAPRVVAKGSDVIAQKIREVADEHRIPRVESPALARALFRHVEIEQEIPSALFRAVAQVLAYVYQLRGHRQGPLPQFQQPELPLGWDPYDPRSTGFRPNQAGVTQ